MIRALTGPAVVVLSVILLGSAIGFTAGLRAYNVHLAKLPIQAPDGRQVAFVPSETDSWIRIGADDVLSAEMVEELGTDNYLSRSYAEKDPADPGHRQIIDLHLAYYTGTIDTVPHVPERCFVAGGLLVGEGSIEMPLGLDTSGWLADPSAEGLMTARTSNRYSDRPGSRARLPRGAENLSLYVTGFQNERGEPFYAGYCFLANGGWVARAEGVRLLAFKLTDDYAYFLKVQCSSQTAGSREEFAACASSLLGELLPEIMRCVPDWTEVERGEYPEDADKNPD